MTDVKQGLTTARGAATRTKNKLKALLSRGHTEDLPRVISKFEKRMDEKDSNDAYVAMLEVDDDIEHESRRYNDTAQSVDELLQQAQRAMQTTEEAAEEGPDAPPPDVNVNANAIKIRMKKIKLQAQTELNNLRMMRLDQGMLDPESDDDSSLHSI